jgi:hypothetical protein
MGANCHHRPAVRYAAGLHGTADRADLQPRVSNNARRNLQRPLPHSAAFDYLSLCSPLFSANPQLLGHRTGSREPIRHPPSSINSGQQLIAICQSLFLLNMCHHICDGEWRSYRLVV